jgi:RND family efflux transporter MFP subunit
VVLVAIIGALLHHHAATIRSHRSLAESPKQVTAVRARTAMYQPVLRYVGTLRPWIEARVGPQFVSAYVATVLVRPGAVVKRGQVLATLDCRDVSARSRSVEMQARALQSEQTALAAQAERVTRLLDGGFISANDVEQRTAESSAQLSKVEAERATLAAARLSVDDCVLRAPFDGDIGERWVDPGAFVRPGDALLSLVDRDVVRFVFDVPETDFDSVAPGTNVQLRLLALNQETTGRIARRSPSADPSTRTIHVEVDLPDLEHRIPVNTTAEARIGAGVPEAAVAIPLIAADIAQGKARLFTLERSVARQRAVPVLGESGGNLYLRPADFAEGELVVLEGRSALNDQDKVTAKEVALPSSRNGDDGGTSALSDPARLHTVGATP